MKKKNSVFTFFAASRQTRQAIILIWRPKMDASARAMVEAIHATPTQAVLYFAGGASQVLWDFL